MATNTILESECAGFSDGLTDEVWMITEVLAKTTLFSSLYVTPNQQIEIEVLLQFLKTAIVYTKTYGCVEITVQGDFNCRHPKCCDHTEKAQGSNLEKFFVEESQ